MGCHLKPLSLRCFFECTVQSEDALKKATLVGELLPVEEVVGPHRLVRLREARARAGVPREVHLISGLRCTSRGTQHAEGDAEGAPEELVLVHVVDRGLRVLLGGELYEAEALVLPARLGEFCLAFVHFWFSVCLIFCWVI